MSALDFPPAVRSPRKLQRPQVQLSQKQERVMDWVALGASLQAACQLADIGFCVALGWLDAGPKSPGSSHGKFLREVQALEPKRQPSTTEIFWLAARNGSGHLSYGSNGHANSSNGQAQPRLLSFDDL